MTSSSSDDKSPFSFFFVVVLFCCGQGNLSSTVQTCQKKNKKNPTVLQSSLFGSISHAFCFDFLPHVISCCISHASSFDFLSHVIENMSRTIFASINYLTSLSRNCRAQGYWALRRENDFFKKKRPFCSLVCLEASVTRFGSTSCARHFLLHQSRFLV